VALGGKVLLAEFPELCGVEQELINRTILPEAAHKFIHLMKSYNDAAFKVGSGFHMNPSPGNIKDGLITDAIKSKPDADITASAAAFETSAIGAECRIARFGFVGRRLAPGPARTQPDHWRVHTR
jgi:hypothetical protein